MSIEVACDNKTAIIIVGGTIISINVDCNCNNMNCTITIVDVASHVVDTCFTPSQNTTRDDNTTTNNTVSDNKAIRIIAVTRVDVRDNNSAIGLNNNPDNTDQSSIPIVRDEEYGMDLVITTIDGINNNPDNTDQSSIHIVRDDE